MRYRQRWACLAGTALIYSWLLDRTSPWPRPMPAFTGIGRAASCNRCRSKLIARCTKDVGQNPFDILELTHKASTDEVRLKFRKLARVYHPDIPETGSEAAFKALNWANEELQDLRLRSQWWNLKLQNQRPRAGSWAASPKSKKPRRPAERRPPTPSGPSDERYHTWDWEEFDPRPRDTAGEPWSRRRPPLGPEAHVPFVSEKRQEKKRKKRQNEAKPNPYGRKRGFGVGGVGWLDSGWSLNDWD